MRRWCARWSRSAPTRWTGLDERLANSVLDGLYRLLAEVLVDQDHPLRLKIEQALAELAHNLQHDPTTAARVETIKRDVLAHPGLSEWWMGVWERLRLAMLERARDPQRLLAGQLGASLAELGESLRSDAQLQWQVNRFARRTLVGTTNRYGEQIVGLVSETVKKWDAGSRARSGATSNSSASTARWWAGWRE